MAVQNDVTEETRDGLAMHQYRDIPVQGVLRGFTPVMDAIAKKHGVIRAAVFGKIWRYCQMKDRACRASMETIAEGLGIDRTTAHKHVEALVADGYLRDLTPELKNTPHVYVDTGKVSLNLTVSVDEVTPTVDYITPTVDKTIMKKDSKKDGKILPVANAPGNTAGDYVKPLPGGLKPLEIEQPSEEWLNQQALYVEVPGGNKAQRALHTARCDQCSAILTQDRDDCPECRRPVQWHNSPEADRRAKQKRHALLDAKAREDGASQKVLELSSCFLAGTGPNLWQFRQTTKAMRARVDPTGEGLIALARRMLGIARTGTKTWTQSGFLAWVANTYAKSGPDAYGDTQSASQQKNVDESEERLIRGAMQAAREAGMEVRE